MQATLIRIPCEYKGKDGKDHKSYDYYLQFENGEYIAIMPKWSNNSNDFVRLRAYSTLGQRK